MPNQAGIQLDAYTPESRLLAALLQGQKQHPVYSGVQGLADVAGDLADAYAQKKLLNTDAARAQVLAQAMQTASDPNLATAGGQVGSNNGGMFTPTDVGPQQPGQSAGPQNPGMQYAQVSLPADMAGAQAPTANQRAAMAMASLMRSPQMAAQYGPQVMDLARQYASQNVPKPLAPLKPGEVLPGMDPITGAVTTLAKGGPQLEKMAPGEGLSSVDAGGGVTPIVPTGAAQTEASKDAIQAGYKPGTPEYQKFMRDRLQKDVPITWRPATPEENVANGLPPNSRGAQVSSSGEFKPPTRSFSETGPLYDAYGRLLDPTADYKDPGVRQKLQDFQAYTKPPTALPPQTSEDLSKSGEILKNYKQLADDWKPEYAHQVTSVTDMFKKSPANEWWYKFDNVLLPQVQALGGGRAAIAKRISEASPKRTDAGDVVPGKLAQMQELIQGQLNRKASSLATEGYNRGAIETAVGFRIDPKKALADLDEVSPSEEGAPGVSKSKTQKWVRDAQGNPVPLQ